MDGFKFKICLSDLYGNSRTKFRRLTVHDDFLLEISMFGDNIQEIMNETELIKLNLIHKKADIRHHSNLHAVVS